MMPSSWLFFAMRSVLYSASTMELAKTPRK
jgi:hypothetical protein